MGLSLYSPAVARLRIDKHLPVATKNCWRRCFLCGSCRIRQKAISSYHNSFHDAVDN
jgi:hypothetical protein